MCTFSASFGCCHTPVREYMEYREVIKRKMNVFLLVVQKMFSTTGRRHMGWDVKPHLNPIIAGPWSSRVKPDNHIRLATVCQES